MDDVIYLDNHATTRCDPRVVEAMLPWLTERFGNAGSLHAYGERAREAIDAARRSIAAAIGAAPEEIVFTSGATESNNLGIRGVAERERRRGDHLVSVATEHRAVLDPLARLAKRGYEVTLLDVEPDGSPRAGWLDPQRVADAITERTCLVSVMLASNEIGVVHPIRRIAQACRERGVLLHCDATQAVGKRDVKVDELGVDLMSFTAHKLYGPPGVGALYVRRRDPIVRLDAQIAGGGQERGRRSGTLNTPGIVGFGRAIELCEAARPEESRRLAALRDRLWEGLERRIEGARLVGPGLDQTSDDGQPIRLAHNLCFALPGLDGEALMLAAPTLALSSGAACSSTDPAPSHVLTALGLTEDQARATLRIGLGRFNTEADVATAVEALAAAAARVRALA
ncbi:cysteine desulfurase family protein [Botrimarina sp.]|uniref:cysteine desulfurase family protein n=1 Tax=Botrimarina sp. TaxID=2795802 RepID=UPI0032EBFB15